jgi:hypothetical protein
MRKKPAAKRKKPAPPMVALASGKPMNEWIWPDDFDQFHREQLMAYKGDAYIVEDLMGSYDWTEEEARAQVRDLPFLIAWLRLDGFLSMLQDRTARETVRTHLLRGDTEMIEVLTEAVQALRQRKKPGPRPRHEGKYVYERIAELYFNKGKSPKEIAIAVYGDALQERLVKVHIAKAKKIEQARKAAAAGRRASK